MKIHEWKLLLAEFDNLFSGWKTLFFLAIIVAALYVLPEGKIQHLFQVLGVFGVGVSRIAKKVNQ